MKVRFFLLIVFLIIQSTFGQKVTTDFKKTKFENLAPTPPMGWSSWNKFQENINEKLIRETADAMVSSGMKDAGYTYINLDDGWQGERDSLGFIRENKILFPSGMKALADYVHSRGLKLGIYSDAGDLTCFKKEGSRGYEFQDALMYAKWGADFLKYDWCNTESINAEGAYKTMSAALRKAGRPMIFNVCEWGMNKPWEWAGNISQMWRTTGDIANCFDCEVDYGTFKTHGVLHNLDLQVNLRKYAGPNHWNDPDMMQVGNTGLNFEEGKTHFSIWAMLSAPLVAGNDLRNMSKETIEILTNRDVIAVNQDELGIQALKYKSINNIDVWVKPLKNNNWAVCFMNRSKMDSKLNFDWKKNNVNDEIAKKQLNCIKNTYNIKDLWSKKQLNNTSSNITVELPPHGCLMLLLTLK